MAPDSFVRLGDAALSEAELVAVVLFVQAGAGLLSARWTRSKASLRREGVLRWPPRSEKDEPR